MESNVAANVAKVVDFYKVVCSRSIPTVADLSEHLAPNVDWKASRPFGQTCGVVDFLSQYLLPIKMALPDLEYRPFVRVAGEYDGAQLDGDGAAGEWVNSTGYFVGTFVRHLFGIPPTGKSLYLRFGELLRLREGKIVEAYVIVDFLDAMFQAGVLPIRPSLGFSGAWLPPATLDGTLEPTAKLADTDKSRRIVMEMLSGLGRYDGQSLLSMDQEKFWHPDFMWFGPGGIGTTRGLDGFRAHHQGPFLRAFPTRAVDRTKSLVANGNYVSAGGWPHMTAVHLGPGWLGLAPTGKQLTMRVMDFWRRDGELLKENWVSIDMVDILEQLGVDVFELMRQMLGDTKQYIGRRIAGQL